MIPCSLRCARLGPALLLAVLGWGLLAPSAGAEIVRLKDGRLVHGEIVAFDESVGITVARADNGGTLRLRWEHLPGDEITRIKADRGFTGEEPEPYLVPVVHLILSNGTTESGILVDDGQRDVYTVRRRSGTDSFPKNYVRRVEPGKVEGLVVYRADELYEVMLAERGAPVDAPAHLAMGVACEGAALYDRALEHYAAVAELDAELKPDLIEARTQRLAIKLEDAVETEQLDEIRNRLYRKQFGEALSMTAAFREEYPLSRQLGELEQLESEILSRRRGHVSGRIVSDYFSFLGKSLSEISRTDIMDMETAVELVEDSVHEEVLDRLTRVYDLSAEELGELWESRKGGSVRSSSYGSGSFILGETKALDWSVGRDETNEEDLVVTEEDDLQDKIDKVLRQRAEERADRLEAARTSALLDEGVTPEEWWEAQPNEDRQRWLLAYYAEFTGMLDILRAKPRDCRRCAAEGVIQIQNEKSEFEYITCTVCKGLQYERIVSFR